MRIAECTTTAARYVSSQFSKRAVKEFSERSRHKKKFDKCAHASKQFARQFTGLFIVDEGRSVLSWSSTWEREVVQPFKSVLLPFLFCCNIFRNCQVLMVDTSAYYALLNNQSAVYRYVIKTLISDSNR